MSWITKKKKWLLITGKDVYSYQQVSKKFNNELLTILYIRLRKQIALGILIVVLVKNIDSLMEGRTDNAALWEQWGKIQKL